MSVNHMPREKGIDNSLDLLKEGYTYITNRNQNLDSDVFQTRLLGQKAICMVGKEAAEIFYDTEKFKRKNAAPNRLIQTLFGEPRRFDKRKRIITNLTRMKWLNPRVNRDLPRVHGGHARITRFHARIFIFHARGQAFDACRYKFDALIRL